MSKQHDMRYAQIKDILEQVRQFHGQLVNYFRQLSEKSGQQRLKMLLDHLSSHEAHLQQGLAVYEEGAAKKIMNTWVDCRQCQEILITCKQVPVTPDMSVDSVIRLAIDIDNCLLRFYREVANHAEAESVREVFRNLIEMEATEIRKLAMNALQATDF